MASTSTKPSGHAKENMRRWADPEYHDRVSSAISKAQKQRGRIISRYVRRSWNRLTRSERKARTSHLWKGSGKISSVQQFLCSVLGVEWKLEYVIGTGFGAMRRGYPSRYFIDIAHPELKIAVEVDGAFHRLASQKEKDRKKNRWLRAHGWRIIRVENSAINWSQHAN